MTEQLDVSEPGEPEPGFGGVDNGRPILPRQRGATPARTARRRARAPEITALVLGTAGVAYRLGMTLAGSPRTNSDEATTGLMARHIADGSDFPPFFYAQHYLGALQAYLQAPLFALFGATVEVQRLVPLGLWAVFIVAMYRLCRRLYPSAWFATAVVGGLALASDRVIKDDMIAGGGYPEINALGAVTLLGVASLVTRQTRWITATLGLVGAAAGLALWADFLIAPFLGLAALLLVLYRRSDLWGRGGAVLLLGFVLGAAPMLWHDLTHPLAQNSIISVLSTTGADTGQPAGLAQRLHGGLLIGVPLAGGLCRPGVCGPAQLTFGALYPALVLLAGALAVLGWRRAVTRVGRARHATRLALLIAAAATLAAYLRSPAAAQTPIESARYLSPLFLALPVVLWPLWQAAAEHWRPWPAWTGGRALPRVAGAVAVIGLVGWLTMRVYGTATAIADLPAQRQFRADQQALVDALDQRGLTSIYSEYWTCNRIAFATKERVTCAVVSDTLGRGLNRYGPYWDAVSASSSTVYVLPVGGPPDLALTAAGAVPDETVAGYHLYLNPPAAARTGALWSR